MRRTLSLTIAAVLLFAGSTTFAATVDEQFVLDSPFTLEAGSESYAIDNGYTYTFTPAARPTLGFTFAGDASNLSGIATNWASHTRLLIEDAAGDLIYDVGGNGPVNDWDFQGFDSRFDGSYESTHTFDEPIAAEGDWTLTFYHDYDQSDDPIIWSDSTFTLQAIPEPASAGLLALGAMAMLRRRRRTC